MKRNTRATMPNSIRENNNDVRAFAAAHKLESALDVGPGEGTYHALLHDLIPEIDCVEIWPQNVADFSLRNRYHEVWTDDIRHHINSDEMYDYDLIVFGDILEHLPVDDAVQVFTEALRRCRWVIVSVPMVHFPQDAIDGNQHEHHEIEDPQTDLIPLLPSPAYSWVYNITGTFIYRGAHQEGEN